MSCFFKRSLLLLLLSINLIVADAQVSLLFNANAHGRHMKGLSFLQIINSSAENYTGSLSIEIKNLTGSGVFVKVFIPSVSIKAGNNILPPAKLSSATISYAGNAEGNYVKQTAMMPEGELEYCFRLALVSKIGPDEIFENCFLGTNIIGSPLQLVVPDKGDEFCEKRPRFTWQPPLPLTTGMLFSLKLVKINTDQSAAEALLVNTPVIYQANLKGFTMSYPAGIPDLKENETYAWQVTANDHKGKQALSEVWEFSIQCPKMHVDSTSYRELRVSDDGGFLSTGSTLKFAVYNPFISASLKYSITDLSKPGRPLKNLPAIQLDKGANHISIDLNMIPGIREDQEYKLTVTLPDGSKVSLRFKYKN
jgi:hypothetical protein